MLDVLTIGETMGLFMPIDFEQKFKTQTFATKTIGGSESNVAIGVSRLGKKAGWFSLLGKDPFGEEIIFKLNGEGVDTSSVKLTDGRTGLMLKEKSFAGDPKVFYYRENSAASKMTPADLPVDLIKQSKILHVTGITPALSQSCRETIEASIDIAKENGVKVSFDPNLRLKLWDIETMRKVIIPMAKKADIFFPGLSEARILLDNAELTANECVQAFLDMGIPEVVLKLGPEGAISATENEKLLVEGFSVKEVDSVGAGDGFCAGYLVGYLSGLSLYERTRMANAVGSIVVGKKGDYEGLPTMEELEQFLGNREIVTR